MDISVSLLSDTKKNKISISTLNSESIMANVASWRFTGTSINKFSGLIDDKLGRELRQDTVEVCVSLYPENSIVSTLDIKFIKKFYPNLKKWIVIATQYGVTIASDIQKIHLEAQIHLPNVEVVHKSCRDAYKRTLVDPADAVLLLGITMLVHENKSEEIIQTSMGWLKPNGVLFCWIFKDNDLRNKLHQALDHPVPQMDWGYRKCFSDLDGQANYNFRFLVFVDLKTLSDFEIESLKREELTRIGYGNMDTSKFIEILQLAFTERIWIQECKILQLSPNFHDQEIEFNSIQFN